MYRLAIFIFLIYSAATVTAKLHRFNISRETGIESNHDEDYDQDTLWVLKLNEIIWNSLEIRKANGKYKENFEMYAVPMINRYLLNQSKDSSEYYATRHRPERSQEEDVKEVKTQLFTIINKLIFKYYPENPNNLGNYTESPLVIYFKDPFTAILIQHDFRHWLYLVQPPSPLPSWFYEQHENITTGVVPDSVPVPNDVIQELYPALLSLVASLLDHPL